ncbi:MAG: glycosyl transferase [Rhodothermaceae bacterium]|nr:MAG: glycosyl transferase [Rhodothermaceae bacterium]
MSADAKKLALVGPVYPYRGGIAHFTEATYRGLQARGHDVAAITFRRQYPAWLFPGTTQFEATPPADPIPAERLIDTVHPGTWLRSARHIARLAPEAVVFQYWMPFFAPAFGTVARWLRRRDIPALAVVHNALPHEGRPGDRALSRYFLRACAGYVTLSEAVTRDLATLGVRGPVRQVAHPVYDRFGDPVPKAEARAALDLPPDAPVLLFFGFVRRYKGLHVLLEALPRIVAERPDVRLVVAGEFYEDEAPYRQQIATHGLSEHVHLHAGYIPNDRVATYFSAADLVVQPYVSATQSGVAQIAFHFERPVVVTDVGGLAEVVPHGRAGLVVPPGDPEALAGAVLRFFREGLAGRLAEGVRAQKERYGWTPLLEAIEALIPERTAPETGANR